MDIVLSSLSRTAALPATTAVALALIAGLLLRPAARIVAPLALIAGLLLRPAARIVARLGTLGAEISGQPKALEPLAVR
jgi:hypothetical protein